MISRRPIEGIPAGIVNHAQPTSSFDGFGNGATLDLQADDLVAGAVGTWTNRGSAGGTFTAAGGARPTCVAAAVNGHNVVDFDGTDDIMASTLILSNILSAAAYTFFAVVSIDAIDTNQANAYENDAIFSGGNEFHGLHLKAGPLWLPYHFDGGGKSDSVTTALGSYLLLQARYDGTKIYARSGSAAETAGSAAGNITTVTDTVRLGRNGGGLAFFDGKLACLIGFATNLSAGDITGARTILASRYGIAV